VKWAGVAYLLYLAGRLWTASGELGAAAEPRAGDADDRPLRLLLASLSLTLGNPKPMVFFMALLPTLVDLPQLTLAGALQIALVIVVVMSATLVSYTLLAERARRLLTDARQVRVVNRVCGSAIAGAAVAVAQQ
jgi:threonine/homoserine/homoserine lactone efflux protein